MAGLQFHRPSQMKIQNLGTCSLNCGKAHNWPGIYFAPFALAPDYDIWRIQALLARDEFIHAALQAFIGIDKQLAGDKTKGH